MQYNQVTLEKPPFCTYRHTPEVLSSASPPFRMGVRPAAEFYWISSADANNYLSAQSWVSGRPRSHMQWYLENAVITIWKEFGSWPKTIVLWGRCDKVPYHCAGTIVSLFGMPLTKPHEILVLSAVCSIITHCSITRLFKLLPNFYHSLTLVTYRYSPHLLVPLELLNHW